MVKISKDGGTAHSPKRSWAIVWLCSLALALSAGATPARAVVAKIGGHGYGVTPIRGADKANLRAPRLARQAAGLALRPLAHRYDAGPSGGTQLVNVESGPVMHSATTHVIYWDPNKEFTGTTMGIVDAFFANIAHDSGLPTNVFAVAGQYTDSTGHAAYSSTSTASRTDTEAYPAGECTVPTGAFADPGPPYAQCMLDEQLQEELTRFIAAEKLPVGPTQLYFLLLPHKVVTCFEEEAEIVEGVFEQACSNNVFCAYHSSIEPATASEIIYADIPFSLLDTSSAKGCQADGHEQRQLPNGDVGTSNTETRFADIALKYISHEFIEAATDPLVGFHTAWVDKEGLEIGDKCNGVPFTPGEEGEPGVDKHAFTPALGGTAALGTLFNQSISTASYYLQSEWDNGASACLMKPLALTQAAIDVGAAISGSPVSFNGSALDPYGGFEPRWTFGDGATATGPSPSHTYATAGTYTVTMTPKDALTGSTGSAVSRLITVTSPPLPAARPPVVPETSAAATAQTVAPSSAFFPNAGSFSPKTGAITFKATLAGPGTLTWLATFQNGKFGAFVSAAECKTGHVRLGRKCLPAKIVFARGSRTVAAAGAVSLTLKPSPSATRALKNALKRGKGVRVSIVLSFKSARGGSATAHRLALTVKLKK